MSPIPIPEKLMACPGRFVINEGANWIAYEEPTGISIVDLSSKSLLYKIRSPWPLNLWGLSLSPDGRELCFRSWRCSINIGPLIFDTQEKQLYRVLDYPVDNIFRSHDGSKLVIGAPPKAWILDVAPDLPICQMFGQKIPENDLIADQIERKSRAIAADPLYPENYLERALAYMSVGQRLEAEADMREFEQLITKQDQQIGYKILVWIRKCYASELCEAAELLAPYAERLMDRFPESVLPYRDVIREIVEEHESNGKTDLAERWKEELQELDRKDE